MVGINHVKHGVHWLYQVWLELVVREGCAFGPADAPNKFTDCRCYSEERLNTLPTVEQMQDSS